MHRDCPRCADLEEEVAFLKSELGIRDDAEELHDLKLSLGLRGTTEASVLRRMFDAGGRVVMKVQLQEAIPARDDVRDRLLKEVDIYVCRLRKRLGAQAIETVYGKGYRLSASGMDIVGNVLNAYRAYIKARRRTAA